MIDNTFTTQDTAFIAYLRVLGKDYQNAEKINAKTVEYTVSIKHKIIFDKWEFLSTKDITLIKKFHHFNRELIGIVNKILKGEENVKY